MTACVDGDRGAATVWAAGAIAVLVGVAVLGLHLGAAMVARHHAESAADLAALAGAATVVTGERSACAQARRVTDQMRVQLVSCRTQGWDVLVDVAANPRGWIGGLGSATGRARAGPAAEGCGLQQAAGSLQAAPMVIRTAAPQAGAVMPTREPPDHDLRLTPNTVTSTFKSSIWHHM